eukprot:TRINITY_DN72889_c0_g1_i1.p1 TRINITY_DN72889_c0_g1~~TRINITY_DN72889_c0_g1_i1.p1  ORF type:complete len:830 (-),score=157.23 TRINITY_DN72889_c0_g1_i1:147-2267(-)
MADVVETSTKVESVEPSGDGWIFSVRPDGQEVRKETFDYCVVATGMYSKQNNFIPEAEGRDSFAGNILHSSSFRDPKVVSGKRVVVTGNGKSAIDCAVQAHKAGAQSVTLLSRNAHWPTPLKIADFIPFQYIFLSRFGQALVIGHKGSLPGCSPSIMDLWHKVSWPFMAVAFKIVEVLFAAQFRNMSGRMSPLGKCDVVEDFYGYAQVLNYDFRDLVQKGAIEWRKGTIESYSTNSVTIDSSPKDVDVVIHATGFKKDYSIFPESTLKELNIEEDGLYLYRHTLPTRVPRLGFVGSELAVISNSSGYGIQADWLARLWAGKLKEAPSSQTMEDEIAATKAWKRKWMPNTPSRASLVLLHQIHYYDRLLKDMGVQHRRKGANFVAELLMPYQPRDYDGIMTQRCAGAFSGGALRASRPAAAPKPVPYSHCTLPRREDQVLMGAVSYDPAVSSIWEGMRSYLNAAGCPFDFVLFTNYEQQVRALLDGHIDIAWNGPVAHVMTQRAAGEGGSVSLGMRDCDRDFKIVIVARKDAKICSASDLHTKLVATGASDSPQACVVPVQWLKEQGIAPSKLVPFDIDLGKHGDTALGEIAAMEALVKGDVDAALLSSMMWERGLAGQLESVDASALANAAVVLEDANVPVFDHCQFDALASIPAWKRESFSKAIFAMTMADPEQARVMKLEGISKTWMPPREEGYDVIRRALASK